MRAGHKRQWGNEIVFALGLLLASNLLADSIPNVPITKQVGNWRCWAGASESILKYYVPGFKKTQLELASVITSQDKEIPKEDIVKCIEINGKEADLKAQLITGTLSWAQMKQAAQEKRPFIILLYWPIAPEYHCNVYAGFITDSTRIKCMDPIAWTGSAIYYPTYQQLIKGNPKLSNAYWYYTILISGGNTALDEMSGVQNKKMLSIVNSTPFGQKKNSVTFINNADDGACALDIFNAAGVRLYHTTISSPARQAVASIPFSFSSGAYFVTYRTEHANNSRSSESKSIYFVR
jgi:hypothetical protein